MAKTTRKNTLKNTQLGFELKGFEKPQTSFGGSLSDKSNPKTKRPLDSKMPIHLVFKANKSVLRLPKTFARVTALIEKRARKYGVKIYSQANVGNHIHLVVRMANRQLWNGFIRDFSSSLSYELRTLGLLAKKQKLWKHRPFTRIVQGWKRAFKSLMEYVNLNQLEALGIIERNKWSALRQLHEVWRINES